VHREVVVKRLTILAKSKLKHYWPIYYYSSCKLAKIFQLELLLLINSVESTILAKPFQNTEWALLTAGIAVYAFFAQLS
jgi:hypothetical protein